MPTRIGTQGLYDPKHVSSSLLRGADSLDLVPPDDHVIGNTQRKLEKHAYTHTR